MHADTGEPRVKVALVKLPPSQRRLKLVCWSPEQPLSPGTLQARFKGDDSSQSDTWRQWVWSHLPAASSLPQTPLESICLSSFIFFSQLLWESRCLCSACFLMVWLNILWKDKACVRQLSSVAVLRCVFVTCNNEADTAHFFLLFIYFFRVQSSTERRVLNFTWIVQKKKCGLGKRKEWRIPRLGLLWIKNKKKKIWNNENYICYFTAFDWSAEKKEKKTR